MKKLILVVFVLTLILLPGCSKMNKSKDDSYFYVGHGDSWLATYSLVKIEDKYYDSLVIQHIMRETKDERLEKIGPIEYELVTDYLIRSSSYPRELDGNAYLHTGSIMNEEIPKFPLGKTVELTVKWKGNEELITLTMNN